MCENGCMSFSPAEIYLLNTLEARLRRIEDMLKNHELVLVENVI